MQWARHRIRVNTVAPGFFRSEITAGMYDDERSHRWLERHTPLPDDGTVDDLVGAVLWLASDAGRYVTGQTIVIDGGWTAAASPPGRLLTVSAGSEVAELSEGEGACVDDLGSFGGVGVVGAGAVAAGSVVRPGGWCWWWRVGGWWSGVEGQLDGSVAGRSGGAGDAVAGGDGVGAVGFETVSDSLAVVLEVAATALGHGVGQVGGAAVLPGVDVVDVAAFGAGVAARRATAAVVGQHGAALNGAEGADCRGPGPGRVLRS